MNAGSPKIVVRFPEEVMDEIAAVVAKLNLHPTRAPYTLSSWVRKCVMYELAHLNRGEATKRVEIVDVKLEVIE